MAQSKARQAHPSGVPPAALPSDRAVSWGLGYRAGVRYAYQRISEAAFLERLELIVTGKVREN